MRPRRASRAPGLVLGLSVTLACAVEATAAEGIDPGVLVGGDSQCPTPAAVWLFLAPLVPGDVLLDRLRVTRGAGPPVQVFDLGSSFLVIAAHRVREYPEPARACAERARFAAVFIAIATGADPASAGAAVATNIPPVVAPVALPPAAPPQPRLRLEVGATATAGLGGGAPTVAPGVAVRAGFGQSRLVPVAAVAFAGPANGSVGGVDTRQWQGTADLDLRAGLPPLGAARPYFELGAVVEVLIERPTNLSTAASRASYAVGPRAAAGVRLGSAHSWSPFVSVHGAWFPGAPKQFALPAGDLGRTASWNLGATGGVSWGLR